MFGYFNKMRDTFKELGVEFNITVDMPYGLESIRNIDLNSTDKLSIRLFKDTVDEEDVPSMIRENFLSYLDNVKVWVCDAGYNNHMGDTVSVHYKDLVMLTIPLTNKNVIGKGFRLNKEEVKIAQKVYKDTDNCLRTADPRY